MNRHRTSFAAARKAFGNGRGKRSLLPAIALAAFALAGTPASAEIDGHGPDAWRVTGVAANDVLNARMGPGTQYLVIDRFFPGERGLQQVTCVPLLTTGIYARLSEKEIASLPPRWCLMRSSDLTRAGWVAQRFIEPDESFEETDAAPGSGGVTVEEATRLVRALHDAQLRADRGQGPDPLYEADAGEYFTAEIVRRLEAGDVGAHPVWGAQDFDGELIGIAADPDTPMLRGTIIIHADFTNFGQRQRATYYLRADDSLPGAPLRIMRIEHDGWSLP